MMKQQLTKSLDLAALTPAARFFVESIAERPDLPMRLAKMALMFRHKNEMKNALLLARAAKAMAPEDYHITVMTEWLSRREVPLWHFRIIHDQLRNEAYARAIKRFVGPGMVVFEIGTGTGILSMLAARAGAKHVYTCERHAGIAETARAIIEQNGLADRITVIAKDAKDIKLGEDIPERADVFLAELVDNSLLGEEVLPLTELARRCILKPDAILLPGKIKAMGYLVSGRGYHERYRMTSTMGFDLEPFNRYSPSVIPAEKGGGDVEPLSEAVELAYFDLSVDTPAEASQQVSLRVTREGMAEGIMRWLGLDFGDGITFENRPPQHSSWLPQLHILPTPQHVHPGNLVEVEVCHNRHKLFIFPSTT